MTGKNHMKCCLAGCLALCVHAAVGAAAGEPVGMAASALVGGGHGTGIFPVDAVMFTAFAVAGTPLPDIDSRSSALGRHVRLPFGHRTWTHTAWAVALMALAGAALPVPGGYGLASGYFLHLFLDGFSAMGVCWTYPIRKYVYMEDGVWRTGSGGHGPKRAQGHWLRLYRTGAPDPGRKFVRTDPRTGKKWLTDGFWASAFCAACAAFAVVRLASCLAGRA